MIRSAITNGPQGLSTGYILLESLDLWYQVELIQHSERHKAPRGNHSLHPLLLLPPFCLSISSLCSRRGILHGFQRQKNTCFWFHFSSSFLPGRKDHFEPLPPTPPSLPLQHSRPPPNPPRQALPPIQLSCGFLCTLYIVHCMFAVLTQNRETK